MVLWVHKSRDYSCTLFENNTHSLWDTLSYKTALNLTPLPTSITSSPRPSTRQTTPTATTQAPWRPRRRRLAGHRSGSRAAAAVRAADTSQQPLENLWKELLRCIIVLHETATVLVVGTSNISSLVSFLPTAHSRQRLPTCSRQRLPSATYDRSYSVSLFGELG